MNPNMEQINDGIQKWTVLQYVLPSISLLIATGLGIFLWVYSQNKIHSFQKQLRDVELAEKELEQKKSALTGTIPSKLDPNRNIVTVHFGDSRATYDINTIRAGTAFDPFSMWKGSIIKLTLKDETILISSEFRSVDGKIVAQIIDNEWKINPNNYFDRNYDENALEIIDQDGINKFQIDFTDIYNIRIGGAFIAGNSFWAFPENERSVALIFDEIKLDTRSKMIDLSNSVKRLFKYPSDKHFGQRREVHRIQFTPTLLVNFNKKNASKIVEVASDTMKLNGISFGILFNNKENRPFKVRVIKFEVYFDKNLKNQVSTGSDIVLNNNQEEWMSQEFHFNNNGKSILFSEAKKINYRMFMTVEYSDIHGDNKKIIDLAYSVILTDTGPAYADISK